MAIIIRGIPSINQVLMLLRNRKVGGRKVGGNKDDTGLIKTVRYTYRALQWSRTYLSSFLGKRFAINYPAQQIILFRRCTSIFLPRPTELIFFFHGKKAIKKLSYENSKLQDAHLTNMIKRLLSSSRRDTVYSRKFDFIIKYWEVRTTVYMMFFRTCLAYLKFRPP